jgi:hypothetical protein
MKKEKEKKRQERGERKRKRKKEKGKGKTPKVCRNIIVFGLKTVSVKRFQAKSF